MPEVLERAYRGPDPVVLEPGLVTPVPADDWRLRVRSLQVDGARADYVEADPHTLEVPPLEDRPGHPPQLILVVVLAGSSAGTVGGHRVLMAPKRAVLLDDRAAMRLEAAEPIRAVRLSVDQAELPAELLGRLEVPCVALKDSPLVLGCVGLITGLLQVHNPVVEPHDEGSVGAPLVALQSSLLLEALRQPDGPGAGSIGSRRQSIEAYVEDHLGVPGLSAGVVAAALGVTVRTVHAAFEGSSETVGGLIRRRRVERVKTLLLTRREPPNVGALAARVGLTRDQLTRHFRAETGRSVTDWWRDEHPG